MAAPSTDLRRMGNQCSPECPLNGPVPSEDSVTLTAPIQTFPAGLRIQSEYHPVKAASLKFRLPSPTVCTTEKPAAMYKCH